MPILRSARSEMRGRDDFTIERMRPGVIDGPGADSALGPLAAVDRAAMRLGKVVRMHEHRNDEILTYMIRGTMVHADDVGHHVPVSPSKLMMMNAGSGFRHEETAVEAQVEVLQIFVRPRAADLPAADLPAAVAFHDRPHGVPVGRWELIGGPEGSEAPLRIRNDVRFYDARLGAGDQIDVPVVAGLTPLLYVVEGVVEVGGERLGRGDAAIDVESPVVRALSDAHLTLFLVDQSASCSTAGTISGR